MGRPWRGTRTPRLRSSPARISSSKTPKRTVGTLGVGDDMPRTRFYASLRRAWSIHSRETCAYRLSKQSLTRRGRKGLQRRARVLIGL